MNRSRINTISGIVPPFISLACTLLVLVATSKYCAPPKADEGTAAHVFQLLMVLQLPITVLFVATAHRSTLVRTAATLALQVTAWGVAATSAKLLT